MLTSEEESRINELAYVPEHIVSLMKIISKGEAFCDDGLLYFKGNYWVILVGYPLWGTYTEERILEVTRGILKKIDLDYLWLVAPQMPDKLKKEASVYNKDFYYTLDLSSFSPPRRLLREVEKASEKFSVRISTSYTEDHEALSVRFVKEKEPDLFVKGLYRSVGRYMAESQSALLVNAYDSKENLVAFYVIEAGAKNFLTYLLGCRKIDSKFSHVSDLIFTKMVELAKEMEKKYIHLGLGVNEGVRRFKEKWGGVPTIPYEFAEIRRKRSFFQIIRRMENIL